MVSVSSIIPSYEAWSAGKCNYLCTPCGRNFNHSVAFWNHVSDYHHLDHADFTRLYPKFRVRKEMAMCRACANPMTYDLGKMTAHMINKHDGMTLKEYYNMYIDKAGKEIKKRSRCNTAVITLSKCNISVDTQCFGGGAVIR
jgi:hypothetical protein